MSWPFCPLTYHLKTRQEALEEVFTGVGQGQGAKFWNHDAVLLTVLLVDVAAKEATHVRYSAVPHPELVQHRHPIKPVVVAGKRHRQFERFSPLRGLEGFHNSLSVPKLELSRTVAQEVAIDPGRDGTLYFSGNWLGGLCYGAHQRGDGLQTLQDQALLCFGACGRILHYSPEHL